MERERGNNGSLENIIFRVRHLKAASKDPFFTQYLLDLEKRIQAEKSKIGQMEKELDDKCRLYRERLLDMERENSPVQENSLAQEDCPTQENNPAQEEQGSINGIVAKTQEQIAPWNAGKNKNNAVVSTWGAVYNPPIMSWQPEKEKQRKKNNPEFTIGATILGIVGGVFILLALVIFGMNYLNGFVKGMIQYVAFLALLAVSELIFSRKLPKLGCILSSVAISGLFLATMVNYLVLENFGMWPALIITIVISCFAVFLSQKRDFILYKLIGAFAGDVGFLLMEKDFAYGSFWVCVLIFLVMNLIFALFGAKGQEGRGDVIGRIVHILLNAVFSLIFVIVGSLIWEEGAESICVGVMAVASVLVMQFVFVRKNALASLELKIAYVAGGVIFMVSSFIALFSIDGDFYNIVPDVTNPYVDVYLAAIFAIGIVTLLLSKVLKFESGGVVFAFFVFALFEGSFFMGRQVEGVIITTVLFLMARVAAMKKSVIIRVCDMILTIYTTCNLIFSEGAKQYVLLCGIILGLALISGWKTAVECILTAGLAVFAMEKMPSILKLPAAVGILFVGMLLVNYVKRYRGKHVQAYNILALVFQAICFLLLINPIYRNAYITYLAMLVFGLATLIWLFQERQYENFRGKDLVIGIFLTYMGLVLKTNYSIINSILIMVIALGCVGVGFVHKEKSVRIYGLVIALVICLKIVLYDLAGIPTMQKIILFFVVGIIALIISVIYIILERREEERQTDEQQIQEK